MNAPPRLNPSEQRELDLACLRDGHRAKPEAQPRRDGRQAEAILNDEGAVIDAGGAHRVGQAQPGIAAVGCER